MAKTATHITVDGERYDLQDKELAQDVSDLKSAVSEINGMLELPEEEHFSATSNQAWTLTTLGEMPLTNGVTYTFNFNVASPVESGKIPYPYVKNAATGDNIWHAAIKVGTTSKEFVYTCNSDNLAVLLAFDAEVNDAITVNVDVSTDQVARLDQIENELKAVINYGDSLFTSKYNAIGTQQDSAHATCFKRKRDKTVNGIKFACRAYAVHTYFCAFDSSGDIISSYSLSGSTTTDVSHEVNFGNDVAYYSVQTLATNKSDSYLIEYLDNYGVKIDEIEDTTTAFQNETYAAIKDDKMSKWSEMQLGMFIHWGVYSAWAGEYDGPNIYGETIHVTGGTEWMWQQNKIPKSNYMSKAVDFTAANWNPDYVCMLAKKLNMKQIVITARHHEGFSLMESTHCEWDITDSSCNRDVLMELKNACTRHGLKFSLYVSPLLDWCDEGGYGQQAWHDGNDPYTWSQHETFVKEQIEYLNQLVEKYDPYVIWYDGGTYISVDDYVKEIFNSNQLKNYPYIIVNNRGEGIYDYKLAENTYADHPNTTEKYERCWFLCGWGYNTGHENIANYRTPTQVIWDMLENMGRGFNYLLNISPRGDGSIPSPTETVFNGVSSIMKKYTFFNGAKRVFNYCQPFWGRPIYVGNSLYMFILPGHNGTVNLYSVSTDNIKGVHVYGIGNPDASENYDIVSDDTLTIHNIPTTSDDYYTVVRVDFFNDLTCMDYNIVSQNIPGISIVRTEYSEWASTTTGVLRDSKKYMFGTDNSRSITRFKFDGTTGTHSFSPYGSIQDGSVVLEYTLYDKNMIFISTGSTFELTNGEIYSLEIKKTGAGTLTVDGFEIS